jgi:tRNA threonylcarbamoyladenosine biosynthesis protein TsaB
VLVLALDTTSRSGSAAVVQDGELLGEILGDGSRSHSERLPGDLMRVLEMASVPVEAIDLLAVAAGPGSFTGLRVGIAAMQGVAMALDRRIVPISALEALALAGADGTGLVAAWIDAQRGEVFASLYDSTGTRVVADPSSLPPIQTLTAWGHALSGGAVRFIGEGAARYEAAIRERLGPRARVLPTPALAGFVGKLAAAAPARAVLPHAVVPIYIRRPDVELARSRRAE